MDKKVTAVLNQINRSVPRHMQLGVLRERNKFSSEEIKELERAMAKTDNPVRKKFLQQQIELQGNMKEMVDNPEMQKRYEKLIERRIQDAIRSGKLPRAEDPRKFINNLKKQHGKA